MAIIHRTELNCVPQDVTSFKTFEFVKWKIDSSNRIITVYAIYRPPGCPGQPITGFTEDFVTMLDGALCEPNPFFMGDFNIHVNDPEDVDAIDFMTTVMALGLDQHTSFYTHKCGHTLDLVITPPLTNYLILHLVPGPFFSDHRATIVTVGILKPSVQ